METQQTTSNRKRDPSKKFHCVINIAPCKLCHELNVSRICRWVRVGNPRKKEEIAILSGVHGGVECRESENIFSFVFVSPQ